VTCVLYLEFAAFDPFSMSAVFPHPLEPTNANVYFGRARRFVGFMCSIPRPDEELGGVLRRACARLLAKRPRELLPVPELLPPADSDIERWRSFSGADE
jgi:hypothetical protein